MFSALFDNPQALPTHVSTTALHTALCAPKQVTVLGTELLPRCTWGYRKCGSPPEALDGPEFREQLLPSALGAMLWPGLHNPGGQVLETRPRVPKSPPEFPARLLCEKQKGESHPTARGTRICSSHQEELGQRDAQIRPEEPPPANPTRGRASEPGDGRPCDNCFSIGFGCKTNHFKGADKNEVFSSKSIFFLRHLKPFMFLIFLFSLEAGSREAFDLNPK